MGQIRNKNERRILRAAIEQFAAYGYRGATIDDIAKRAELPKANLHYYFQSKSNLYTEALKQAIAEGTQRDELIMVARHAIDNGLYKDSLNALQKYCDTYELGKG